MNLDKFLLADAPDLESIVARKKIRLVRHSMKGRKDQNWKQFDKELKIDNAVLKAFTGEQLHDKFKDAELLLVFVALSGNRALFRGAFECKGKRAVNPYKERLEDYDRYLEIRRACNIDEPRQDLIFYDLRDSAVLSSFKNRLVVNWGGSAVSWVQRNLNKEILQIMPPGYVEEFPGWQRVLLSHSELAAIIDAPNGNPDWYSFLTRHHGVYVIFDSKTGEKYVGAAHSKEGGIWHRWEGYRRTGHNGNKGLKRLLETGRSHPSNFVYSLHYVCPRSPTSYKEVLEYESLLKKKLGSKDFGLNEN